MEFDRHFELSLDGIADLKVIKSWIDREIGIEYDVELETGSRFTSTYGTVTLFGITSSEDKKLNAWLDEHKYQK